MSMKNSNRTRVLPACIAVHLQSALPRAPHYHVPLCKMYIGERMAYLDWINLLETEFYI